jgi:prolyl oligopeptidase
MGRCSEGQIPFDLTIHTCFELDMAQTSSKTKVHIDYPKAESRPEPVEFGGGAVRYQDPFRWLEEDEDQAVQDWQKAQDALTEAYLTKLPAFSAFTGKLERLGASNDLSVPVFADGRWFITKTPEDQDLSVVELCETPTGPGRRIIDLNAMRKDEPLQLQCFVPSPDGRKAIFGWAAGGREEPNIQIIDIDTGKVLVDGIPHKRPSFFAWRPDSRGVLYMAVDAGALVELDLDKPAEPAAAPIQLRHPVARPMASADGRHVLLFVDHLAPRPDFILDVRGGGGWRPFLKDVPGIFRGDIIGDNFIAITDDGAPRGRLVSIPLASPAARETWKELVPASDNVLGTLLVRGDRAVLVDLADTYARLRVFGGDGKFEGEIALPGRGCVNSFSSNFGIFNMLDLVGAGGDDEIVFIFSTFARGPALYSANLRTHQVVELTKPKQQIDVQVLDLSCTSADGARVVYHVIARPDVDLAKPHPSVIHGYGGFNVAVLPGWSGALWAAWIEAGGVFVLGHLRGGGDFGTPWWEQGRLEHKQNSFNDVFAIGEDLIARGVTTTAQLGVIGGSNGGVMAAAVAVQRPDLFRASVPQVPISDLLARVRDPVTMVSTLDYGDPADPEMAKVLYAWSPYQNVRDNVAYPAMLFDAGANDPRCPPWQSRKIAARMQQASSGDHPILLRVREGAGHGAVGKSDQRRQSAEVLAFLAEHLGLAL